MNRSGVRAFEIGLTAAAAVTAAAVILAGCGGGSGRKDPPAKQLAAGPPVPHNTRLPGADESKARDGGGDLRRVRYTARALGRTDSYLIYLPPGYSHMAKQGKRFPVLYLLHGDGRHQRHGAGHLFQRGRIGRAATALIRSGRLQPMLIVMPESTDATVVGDTEWANTPRGRFASSVIDLVHAVDRTWPTIASRNGRALGGLSMGGYGAMNIALHHLGLFSVVESWSGYFRQTPSGPFVAASPAVLRKNSPSEYVSRLSRKLAANPIHVLLYISRTDPLRVQQGPFADELRRLGTQVESDFFGGPHNFALWANHMRLALSFAGHWLAGGRGG